MNRSRKFLTMAAAIFAFAAIMAPQNILALTAPCTEITNTASLAYNVGNVPQTPVASDNDTDDTNGINPTRFNVGVKVLLNVNYADVGYVTVTPSNPAIKKWLSYTVTNNGNATHQYDLSVFAANTGTLSPFGIADADKDSFNVTPGKLAIYVENSVATDVSAAYDAYTYEEGTDAGTTLTLAPGMTNKVYVVYSPDDLTAAKDSVAVEYLKAVTKWANGDALSTTDSWSASGGNATGKPTADQAGVSCDGNISVDIVFGDGDGDDGHVDGTSTAYDTPRDGAHSAKNAFKVANAVIDHTKTFLVVSDGYNNTCTSNPATNPCKPIPGAVIEYSLAIANTGNAPAILGDITDALNNNFKVVTTGASWAVTGSTRTVNNNDLVIDTQATDADGLYHVNPSAVGEILTAAMATILAPQDLAGAVNDYLAGELKGGETITIKFQATIQ